MIAAVVTLLPGCLDTHQWVHSEKPWSRSTVADSDRVRATYRDGTKVTLDEPRIDSTERGEFLVGRATSIDDRETRIDLEDIRELEVRQVVPGRVAANIAAAVVVVGAIVLFFVNPFLPSA